MSWLKQERFSAQYDFTLNEIRSKVQRKVWRKGIHYAVIDGRRRFNTEAINHGLRAKSGTKGPRTVNRRIESVAGNAYRFGVLTI